MRSKNESCTNCGFQNFVNAVSFSTTDEETIWLGNYEEIIHMFKMKETPLKSVWESKTLNKGGKKCTAVL